MWDGVLCIGCSCTRGKILRAVAIWGELAGNEVERSVIVIRTDSESAKVLVENPIYHSRTKHILAKYHFIRASDNNRSCACMMIY